MQMFDRFSSQSSSYLVNTHKNEVNEQKECKHNEKGVDKAYPQVTLQRLGFVDRCTRNN